MSAQNLRVAVTIRSTTKSNRATRGCEAFEASEVNFLCYQLDTVKNKLKINFKNFKKLQKILRKVCTNSNICGII